jgi:hypothetical protein
MFKSNFRLIFACDITYNLRWLWLLMGVGDEMAQGTAVFYGDVTNFAHKSPFFFFVLLRTFWRVFVYSKLLKIE